MEFFLDTADVDEIREIAAWGILDGVTTNPSLIKKSGRDFKQVVAEIASICDGPISAEVTAMDTEGMVAQGMALKNELPENVIIKIPCTPEGLAATKILTEANIKTNVTLMLTPMSSWVCKGYQGDSKRASNQMRICASCCQGGDPIRLAVPVLL